MAASCAGLGLFFAFIYFAFIREEGDSQISILLFSSGTWFLIGAVILLCRRFINRET
jgi:hypothetical protein